MKQALHAETPLQKEFAKVHINKMSEFETINTQFKLFQLKKLGRLQTATNRYYSHLWNMSWSLFLVEIKTQKSLSWVWHEFIYDSNLSALNVRLFLCYFHPTNPMEPIKTHIEQKEQFNMFK